MTTSRPDIAIVKIRELHILELTVCGNTCDALAAAHARKSGKQDYHHLLADARRNGYTTKYTTIEFGALGHHTTQ